MNSKQVYVIDREYRETYEILVRDFTLSFFRKPKEVVRLVSDPEELHRFMVYAFSKCLEKYCSVKRQEGKKLFPFPSSEIRIEEYDCYSGLMIRKKLYRTVVVILPLVKVGNGLFYRKLYFIYDEAMKDLHAAMACLTDLESYSCLFSGTYDEKTYRISMFKDATSGSGYATYGDDYFSVMSDEYKERNHLPGKHEDLHSILSHITGEKDSRKLSIVQTRTIS